MVEFPNDPVSEQPITIDWHRLRQRMETARMDLTQDEKQESLRERVKTLDRQLVQEQERVSLSCRN